MLPPESMRFLEVLVSAAKPAKILEIGTNIGASGIAMLKACDRAHLYTVEMNEETAGIARRNFEAAGLADRADILIGKAEDILPYMSDTFDFVFLDGPKGQYGFMLSYILPLIAKGGMLVCDNVLFRGMVTGDKKVRARKRTIVKKLDEFLRLLSSDPSLITGIIPIGDGMSVSYKK